MMSTMKLFAMAAISALVTTGSALAQESNQYGNKQCVLEEACVLQIENKVTDEPLFGTYGYRHHYLHSLGVIDRLMKETKSSCCDGGLGGECRVTELSIDMTMFRHGNIWCPLSPHMAIQTNIGLPNDVQAVVCARKTPPDRCPISTYCVAGSFSG